MKTGELCSYLDAVVPLSLQESYDNSGLQVGLPEKEIEAALITLDVTEEVLEEAVSKGCGLIISHHPVIFKGLRKLAWSSPVERIIARAIRNDIAIYSAHTNLDMLGTGVSRKLAEKLGLSDIRVLQPLKGRLLKLVTFVPSEHLERVRNAVFEAGAGFIGNYDCCGFTVAGKGSFRAGEGTNPFVGEKGEMHFENEERFETVLFSHLKGKVIKALLEAHPYEEVAYDIYPLEIKGRQYGMGNVGVLDKPKSLEEFIAVVKEKLSVKNVRVIGDIDREVGKVAVFCGSFDREVLGAAKSKADVLVTGDVKYHDAMDMLEMGMCVIDAGHFNTERIIADRLVELISENFPQIEVVKSNMEEDPFKIC